MKIMVINIKELIDNLGQTAEQLIEKEIIPANKFEYFFEGDDEFFCKPEPGLRLTFHNVSRRPHSVEFVLINVYDNNDSYNGDMPPPFLNSMDKTTVRTLMGEPDSSGGPKKVPVIGLMGGFDAYILKLSEQYPNTNIHFSYLTDLRVDVLAFEQVV
ncbi:DUF6392 family protein [Photorhabdus sp. RW14-46]|uniref:DUF6392 family protein n=2 Tax=Morganellaceae TaxID=1903414 RepID=UPI001F6185AC|nr:DUF6392 family protein [Photorhabdus sp. RW14-46]